VLSCEILILFSPLSFCCPFWIALGSGRFPTGQFTGMLFLFWFSHDYLCISSHALHGLGSLWLVAGFHMNGLTSSKAAKRDDAQIATAMWDQRLMLLYPACTVAVLSRLQSFLLSYFRQSLLKSFRGFLRTRFSVS
jgi:hypothetical protein